MSNLLRAKIIADLVRRNISLDPDTYQDEEWDFSDLPEGQFDINFWFPDENTFKVTAYYTTKNDKGDAVADTSRFFTILQKECYKVRAAGGLPGESLPPMYFLGTCSKITEMT